MSKAVSDDRMHATREIEFLPAMPIVEPPIKFLPSTAAPSFRCVHCGCSIIGSESLALQHCNRCGPGRRKTFRLEALAALASLVILVFGIAAIWFLLSAVNQQDDDSQDFGSSRAAVTQRSE